MDNELKSDVTQVVENLMRIHPMLTKNLNRSIREKTNLNPGSLFILGLLSRNEMLSMSEIGCKMSMPKPHVTAQIDKLIAEKLVERIYDTNDRRIIKIKLTEKGRVDFSQIKMDITQELRQKMEKIDKEKIADLLIASSKVREILAEIMNDISICNKD